MANVLGRPSRVVFLLVAMLLAWTVSPAGPVFGADVRFAALSEAGVPAPVPDISKPPATRWQMTKPPQMAQARCPSGQLVFLSRACGCNGACCRCSREARYLNHCTCQCEAVPTACAQGHSAGNP